MAGRQNRSSVPANAAAAAVAIHAAGHTVFVGGDALSKHCVLEKHMEMSAALYLCYKFCLSFTAKRREYRS